MIGNKAYTITIIIAGFSPIPKNGTAKANKAMQGILCNRLAIPITSLEACLFLVIAIPKGTPINTARKTAMVVRFMCSIKRIQTSGYFSKNKLIKLLTLMLLLFARQHSDIGGSIQQAICSLLGNRIILDYHSIQE